MSEHNKTTFWGLLSRQKIVIPILQRDYAQGRRGKEYLRHRFLLELKSALDDENKFLTLDFVYGVTNADNSIAPLDGQQRLTTLWLLHWYLAFRTGQLSKDEIKNVLRKFSYETRVSSREFCQQLCDLPIINDNKQSLLNYIRQQPWFFSAWKQDPTIQAMLRMLCETKTDDSENKIGDSIERLFSDSSRAELDRYWERLIINEPGNCPITFYQTAIGTTELPLSDDLYIKMNARGKALTSFENFKADLLQWIKKEISEKDSVAYGALIDNQWTDIFWDLAGKETTYCVDEVFFAFVNRYFYNLVITRKDESGNYDPHYRQQECFPPVSLIQYDHNDQIRQTEFDARNSELNRDQCLYIAEDQCKSRKYTEICCSVFQSLIPFYCATASSPLSSGLTIVITT